MNPENSHSNTLFVGSLPATVTNEELESLFGEIGPLKRCFVVAGKGVGYVTYAFREDAETAMKDIKCCKNGKKLNVRVANKKVSKKDTKSNAAPKDPAAANVSPASEEKSKPKYLKGVRQSNLVNKQEGRLILRNLSFKTEVEDLRKAFGKYGKVKEVSIPTKSDGKKQGFGFVQFEEHENAVNAIKNLNAKPFMGRPIAVDHAIPQSEYLRIKTEVNNDFGDAEVENGEKDQKPVSKQQKKAVKVEKATASNHDEEDSDCEWMQSKDDDDEGSSVEMNSESEEGSDDDDEEDELNSNDGKDESSGDDDDSKDELSGNDDDEEKSTNKKKKKFEKPKHKKCDVNEGKTLFIKNLNFTTTSEKLKEVFSQFGTLEYATICVDRLTQHSKGSGFVKFRDRNEAERCLKLISESPKDGGVVIDDFKIEVSHAISKTDLNKSERMKKLDKKKCNRNLYLIREGMVRPGTKAAEGVSQQDLTKRTELDVWKRQMLKNLHTFVSKTRLCVRNLPSNINDYKLRKIFEKAGGAEVTECKVMRFLDQPGPDGYGLSKGYAFVNFTEHEAALKAIRQVNNNPEIFNAQKRPIVEFSLENKSALRAKQKRFERSTMNVKGSAKNSANGQISKVKGDMETCGGDDDGEEEKPAFRGTASEELRFKKGLPSHVGPKIRHNRKISRNSLKKQKKKVRGRNFVDKEKNENRRMHKMMAGRKPKVDADKYDAIRAQRLNSGKKLSAKKKSKWYSQ